MVSVSPTGVVWGFTCLICVHGFFHVICQYQYAVSFLVLIVDLYLLDALLGSTGLVELNPCLFTIMPPFCVSSYSGTTLMTFLVLMSGRVR